MPNTFKSITANEIFSDRWARKLLKQIFQFGMVSLTIVKCVSGVRRDVPVSVELQVM